MSYFSIMDAANVLAHAIKDFSPNDLKILGLFGAGNDTRVFQPEMWTQVTVRANLERARRDLNHESLLRSELDSVLEHVPDDVTCAMIGWFFQGFLLSEAINCGMLANNNPEIQVNLLSALDPTRLSSTVLEMLHDDIHRFNLEDSAPNHLMKEIFGVMPEPGGRIRAMEEEEDERPPPRRGPVTRH